MKRLLSWMLPILFVSVMTGCTTYTKVSTKQITEFEKEIRAEHKQIDDLKVEFSPAAMDFTYYVDGKLEEKEVYEIFYKTKEIILDPNFQKEAIEEKYFDKYFKEERIYPHMNIRFDFDSDDKYDRMFESRYYQTADVSNAEVRKLVDGYKTWSYWDYKSNSVPVPEKDNQSK